MLAQVQAMFDHVINGHVGEVKLLLIRQSLSIYQVIKTKISFPAVRRGLILGLQPANERHRYKVESAHHENSTRVVPIMAAISAMVTCRINID